LSDPAFLRRLASGVTVELRVQPRARRSALDGSRAALKAAVAALPIDGKANAALIALLADSWRLPKSAFAIAKGTTSRTKKISIAGEPALIADRIAQWIETHG
jgi:uncharacterized protein (TIGR00251 family)